jgi:hypothetical protein
MSGDRSYANGNGSSYANGPGVPLCFRDEQYKLVLESRVTFWNLI